MAGSLTAFPAAIIMIREGCRSIPIPVHGSTDLPKGLVHAVLKQAGLKE